jgi:hypothetical protein
MALLKAFGLIAAKNQLSKAAVNQWLSNTNADALITNE